MRWQAALVALGFACAAMLLLYARDAGDMAAIWWSISDFQHLLLVPPVIAWLVWRRRGMLAEAVPTGWAPGLALVAAGAISWLLGDAAGVAFARHLGLVMMLQGAVVATLGRQVATILAFPIGYALLLAPFGAFLVQPLQTLTAGLCMALLHLFAVPAVIDGVLIRIPNGYYEVAEACAGANFVLAMAAFALLAAHLGFRSWRRRAMFVGVAVAMPVVANGVRAFATIYVGWLTNSDAAAGFDHVVYGWVFFAGVLAATLALAWRFFDRAADDLGAPPPPAPHARAVLPAAALAIAIAALPAGWSAIAATRSATVDHRFELPEVSGWQRAAPTGTLWTPHYAGADLRLFGSYRDARGARVELGVAAFASQAEGREVVGYGQGAVGPDSAWIWTAEGTPVTNARVDRITGPGGVVREVATFYRLSGMTTGDERRVKLETLRARLTGGAPGAVAMTVSATDRDALDRFLAALGPIDRVADAALR